MDVGFNLNDTKPVITESIYVNQVFKKLTEKTDKVNDFILNVLNSENKLTSEVKSKLIKKYNDLNALNESIKTKALNSNNFLESIIEIEKEVNSFVYVYGKISSAIDTPDFDKIHEKLKRFHTKILSTAVTLDDLRVLGDKANLQEGIQHLKTIESACKPLTNTLRFFRLPIPKEIEAIENKIKTLQELQTQAAVLKQKFIDLHYHLSSSSKNPESRGSIDALNEEIKAFDIEFKRECQSILNDVTDAQKQINDMKK